MVDKVSVNPLEVRGAGDIVSPKTASDFGVYNSTIVSSSEDVDGAVMTVYTVSYVSGTYFTVSSGSVVPVGDDTFTVSAVLKRNSDDSVVSGAEVTCTVNGDSVLTGTTDSNGSVSFTIPTMEDVSKYTVKLVYSGTGSVGGAFKVTGLICIDLSTLDLSLTVDKSVMQVDDELDLMALLTATDGGGATVGVPSQDINFYVVDGITGELSLTASKSVLSAYHSESATLTATYTEEDAGVSGKTVTFKKGDTVLGTATTNSSGVATYTYNSQGVGDVLITAECMNLQETYEIEDCTYYNPNTVTIITDVSIPLPSAFELSFITHRTSSSTNSAYLEVGGDTGNTALIGQLGSMGESRMRFYQSEGSTVYTDTSLDNNPFDTDTTYVWIKNGSSNTFSMNDESVEVSNSLTHSKIRKLNITNNSIKELKVKPL